MDRTAQDAVVSDPEILGGVPVLRGTRVPAHDVAASVAAGAYLAPGADNLNDFNIFFSPGELARQARLPRRDGGKIAGFGYRLDGLVYESA